jgi:hypothetical protein
VKLFILAGVASLSCVALVAACSSSSNKGSGGNGGDGGASGEGGADAKGSDGGSSSGGTPYSGALAAAETTAGVFDIAGSFVATPDASGTANTCPGSGVMSGSCCYEPPAAASDAGTADAGAADAGTVAVFSAGTITIKDGTSTLANLMPGTNGAYGITSGAMNPTVKWTAGDTLSVSANGATVDAFTGSLVTVVDLAGVTPALSLKTATDIPLASPLVVSWTAGTATTVRVTLIAAKGTAGDGVISCSVDDSAGTVTVPTALLSKLTTGDTGVLSLVRQEVNTATGNNVTVQLLSSTTATGIVKFQ